MTTGLVIGLITGWLTVILFELRQRRRRWRVQRTVRKRDVVFYLAKGLETIKVCSIGIDRDKTRRPGMSFDEALADAVVEARVACNALNGTDRNLQRHG